jgi:hypothetical protein
LVLWVSFAWGLPADAQPAEGEADVPTGLSGLGLGFGGHFGGHFGGDIRQGRVGGQFDFALPPYFSLGPEIMLGFGGNITLVAVGAETRIYFFSNYDFGIQPYALAGVGYSRTFEDYRLASHGDNYVYIHFGGGMDFEMPRAQMAPYFGIGGLNMNRVEWKSFLEPGIRNSELLFSIEGGVRFDLW